MTQDVHEQHSIVDQLLAELKRTYYAGQRPSYAQLKLIAPSLSLEDYKLLVQRFMEFMREQELQLFKDQEQQLTQAYPYIPEHVTEDLLYFEQGVFSQFARFLMQRDQSIAQSVAKDMELQRKQVMALTSENAMLKRENHKLQVQISALETSLSRLDESYQFECKAHQQALVELNKLRESDGAGLLFVKLLKQHLDSPEFAKLSHSLSNSTAEALIALLKRADLPEDLHSDTNTESTEVKAQAQAEYEALMDPGVGKDKELDAELSDKSLFSSGNTVLDEESDDSSGQYASNTERGDYVKLSSYSEHSGYSNRDAYTDPNSFTGQVAATKSGAYAQQVNHTDGVESTLEASRQNLSVESELAKYRHLKFDDLSSLYPKHTKINPETLDLALEQLDANFELPPEFLGEQLGLDSSQDEDESGELSVPLSELKAPSSFKHSVLSSLEYKNAQTLAASKSGGLAKSDGLTEQARLSEHDALDAADNSLVLDKNELQLDDSLASDDEVYALDVDEVSKDEVADADGTDVVEDAQVKDSEQLTDLTNAAQRLPQTTIDNPDQEDNGYEAIKNEEAIKAALAAIISSAPLIDPTERKSPAAQVLHSLQDSMHKVQTAKSQAKETLESSVTSRPQSDTVQASSQELEASKVNTLNKVTILNIAEKIDALEQLRERLFVEQDADQECEDVTPMEIEALVHEALAQNIFTPEQELMCRKLAVKLMFAGRDAVAEQDAYAQIQDLLQGIKDPEQRFLAQAALAWHLPQAMELTADNHLENKSEAKELNGSTSNHKPHNSHQDKSHNDLKPSEERSQQIGALEDAAACQVVDTETQVDQDSSSYGDGEPATKSVTGSVQDAALETVSSQNTDKTAVTLDAESAQESHTGNSAEKVVLDQDSLLDQDTLLDQDSVLDQTAQLDQDKVLEQGSELAQTSDTPVSDSNLEAHTPDLQGVDPTFSTLDSSVDSSLDNTLDSSVDSSLEEQAKSATKTFQEPNIIEFSLAANEEHDEDTQTSRKRVEFSMQDPMDKSESLEEDLQADLSEKSEEAEKSELSEQLSVFEPADAPEQSVQPDPLFTELIDKSEPSVSAQLSDAQEPSDGVVQGESQGSNQGVSQGSDQSSEQGVNQDSNQSGSQDAGQSSYKDVNQGSNQGAAQGASGDGLKATSAISQALTDARSVSATTRGGQIGLSIAQTPLDLDSLAVSWDSRFAGAKGRSAVSTPTPVVPKSQSLGQEGKEQAAEKNTKQSVASSLEQETAQSVESESVSSKQTETAEDSSLQEQQNTKQLIERSSSQDEQKLEQTLTQFVNQDSVQVTDQTPAESVNQTPTETTKQTSAETINQTPTESANQTPAQATQPALSQATGIAQAISWLSAAGLMGKNDTLSVAPVPFEALTPSTSYTAPQKAQVDGALQDTNTNKNVVQNENNPALGVESQKLSQDSSQEASQESSQEASQESVKSENTDTGDNLASLENRTTQIDLVALEHKALQAANFAANETSAVNSAVSSNSSVESTSDAESTLSSDAKSTLQGTINSGSSQDLLNGESAEQIDQSKLDAQANQAASAVTLEGNQAGSAVTGHARESNQDEVNNNTVGQDAQYAVNEAAAQEGTQDTVKAASAQENAQDTVMASVAQDGSQDTVNEGAIKDASAKEDAVKDSSVNEVVVQQGEVTQTHLAVDNTISNISTSSDSALGHDAETLAETNEREHKERSIYNVLHDLASHQPMEVLNDAPRSLVRDESTLVKETSSPSGDDSIAAFAAATAKLESLAHFLGESNQEQRQQQDITFNFNQGGVSTSHVSTSNQQKGEQATAELAKVAQDVLKVANELDAKTEQARQARRQTSIFERPYQSPDLNKTALADEGDDFVSGNIRSKDDMSFSNNVSLVAESAMAHAPKDTKVYAEERSTQDAGSHGSAILESPDLASDLASSGLESEQHAKSSWMEQQNNTSLHRSSLADSSSLELISQEGQTISSNDSTLITRTQLTTDPKISVDSQATSNESSLSVAQGGADSTMQSDSVDKKGDASSVKAASIGDTVVSVAANSKAVTDSVSVSQASTAPSSNLQDATLQSQGAQNPETQSSSTLNYGEQHTVSHNVDSSERASNTESTSRNESASYTEHTEHQPHGSGIHWMTPDSFKRTENKSYDNTNASTVLNAGNSTDGFVQSSLQHSEQERASVNTTYDASRESVTSGSESSSSANFKVAFSLQESNSAEQASSNKQGTLDDTAAKGDSNSAVMGDSNSAEIGDSKTANSNTAEKANSNAAEIADQILSDASENVTSEISEQAASKLKTSDIETSNQSLPLTLEASSSQEVHKTEFALQEQPPVADVDIVLNDAPSLVEEDDTTKITFTAVDNSTQEHKPEHFEVEVEVSSPETVQFELGETPSTLQSKIPSESQSSESKQPFSALEQQSVEQLSVENHSVEHQLSEGKSADLILQDVAALDNVSDRSSVQTQDQAEQVESGKTLGASADVKDADHKESDHLDSAHNAELTVSNSQQSEKEQDNSDKEATTLEGSLLDKSSAENDSAESISSSSSSDGVALQDQVVSNIPKFSDAELESLKQASLQLKESYQRKEQELKQLTSRLGSAGSSVASIDPRALYMEALNEVLASRKDMPDRLKQALKEQSEGEFFPAQAVLEQGHIQTTAQTVTQNQMHSLSAETLIVQSAQPPLSPKASAATFSAQTTQPSSLAVTKDKLPEVTVFQDLSAKSVNKNEVDVRNQDGTEDRSQDELNVIALNDADVRTQDGAVTEDIKSQQETVQSSKQAVQNKADLGSSEHNALAVKSDDSRHYPDEITDYEEQVIAHFQTEEDFKRESHNFEQELQSQDSLERILQDKHSQATGGQETKDLVASQDSKGLIESQDSKDLVASQETKDLVKPHKPHAPIDLPEQNGFVVLNEQEEMEPLEPLASGVTFSLDPDSINADSTKLEIKDSGMFSLVSDGVYKAQPKPQNPEENKSRIVWHSAYDADHIDDDKDKGLNLQHFTFDPKPHTKTMNSGTLHLGGDTFSKNSWSKDNLTNGSLSKEHLSKDSLSKDSLHQSALFSTDKKSLGWNTEEGDKNSLKGSSLFNSDVHSGNSLNFSYEHMDSHDPLQLHLAPSGYSGEHLSSSRELFTADPASSAHPALGASADKYGSQDSFLGANSFSTSGSNSTNGRINISRGIFGSPLELEEFKTAWLSSQNAAKKSSLESSKKDSLENSKNNSIKDSMKDSLGTSKNSSWSDTKSFDFATSKSTAGFNLESAPAKPARTPIKWQEHPSKKD